MSPVNLLDDDEVNNNEKEEISVQPEENKKETQVEEKENEKDLEESGTVSVLNDESNNKNVIISKSENIILPNFDLIENSTQLLVPPPFPDSSLNHSNSEIVELIKEDNNNPISKQNFLISDKTKSETRNEKSRDEENRSEVESSRECNSSSRTETKMVEPSQPTEFVSSEPRIEPETQTAEKFDSVEIWIQKVSELENQLAKKTKEAKNASNRVNKLMDMGVELKTVNKRIEGIKIKVIKVLEEMRDMGYLFTGDFDPDPDSDGKEFDVSSAVNYLGDKCIKRCQDRIVMERILNLIMKEVKNNNSENNNNMNETKTESFNKLTSLSNFKKSSDGDFFDLDDLEVEISRWKKSENSRQSALEGLADLRMKENEKQKLKLEELQNKYKIEKLNCDILKSKVEEFQKENKKKIKEFENINDELQLSKDQLNILVPRIADIETKTRRLETEVEEKTKSNELLIEENTKLKLSQPTQDNEELLEKTAEKLREINRELENTKRNHEADQREWQRERQANQKLIKMYQSNISKIKMSDYNKNENKLDSEIEENKKPEVPLVSNEGINQKYNYETKIENSDSKIIKFDSKFEEPKILNSQKSLDRNFVVAGIQTEEDSKKKSPHLLIDEKEKELKNNSEIESLRDEIQKLKDDYKSAKQTFQSIIQCKDLTIEKVTLKLEQAINRNSDSSIDSILRDFASRDAAAEREQILMRKEIDEKTKQIEQLNKITTSLQNQLKVAVSEFRSIIDEPASQSNLNFNYLRNVIVSYITMDRNDPQTAASMLPAICSLLSLSLQQQQLVLQTDKPKLPELKVNRSRSPSIGTLRAELTLAPLQDPIIQISEENT